MELIRQPDNSNLCGQACVAMIAGISLSDSIAVFRKKGCTSTKHLVAALGALNIKCGDRLTSVKKESKPSLCIVHLHYPGLKFTHWVVFFKGLYFDPALGVLKEYGDYAHETSFLPIYAGE